MKKFLGIVLNRIVYTALFIAIQAAAFVLMFLYFRDNFAWFYVACGVLSFAAALYVINSDSNPAYKIAWIVPMLVFPIFGGLFYLMFGKNRLSFAEKRRVRLIRENGEAAMTGIRSALPASAEGRAQSAYILNSSRSPAYADTETRYFPMGEDMLPALLAELEKAESFIFMEYFIIRPGEMWDSILAVLRRKAAAGVDVRVMYDDFGCLLNLPPRYYRTLEAMGIKSCVFNRFNSILTPRFNNRDHRKICVIDGNVGFTGGINLADEYINRLDRFGRWKDTAVMLHGGAVWNLTVTFLSMWDFSRREKDDFRRFAPTLSCLRDGIVQPFGDAPLDGDYVGETVYLNMINRATRYVWMTTPYLIVDNELMTALRAAAKSGVDVRIITPHIPDKKTVFALTRSYYGLLLSSGVKIYEYTPGFMHSKTFVCDDEFAVIGTINMDFRSLYLHYECGVWFAGSRAVTQLKADLDSTLTECEEILPGEKPCWIKRLYLSILRIFAPLL